MDSIRAPLLPLEQVGPSGVASPPADFAGSIQATASLVPEFAKSTCTNRFEGDGGDVLAFAAIYPISTGVDTPAISDVSAIVRSLGST
jgi:hypothetical protein